VPSSGDRAWSCGKKDQASPFALWSSRTVPHGRSSRYDRRQGRVPRVRTSYRVHRTVLGATLVPRPVREGMLMGGPGGVLWSSPQPSAISAALRALAGAYTVAMDRPVTARRTWLDSADRRLYRAGMALTATAGVDGAAEILEFSGPDGASVTAGPDTAGWPRLLAGLPDELRPRLEPVLGVRALLPVVEVCGSSVAGRLLDAQGKSVLRLVHERPATIAGTRARLPGGLRLVPLRGYATAAVPAGRIVQAAGLVRDDRPGYAAALAAAGVDPDATALPPIRPELPGDVAVARVLLSFLDEMDAVHDGTVADVDIEFLHDFRVAVRRSRSVLRLLGDLLPAHLVAWVMPELRWLGDLTGRSRDLDVHLQELPSMAAGLTSGRPEDLAPMAVHLQRLRASERRRLVRGLRSSRYGRWRVHWRTTLAELAGRHGDGPSVQEISAERLAGAYRRVLRGGARITPESPAEDLHDLRKRCKELRYLLEIFAPVLDAGGVRGAVKELKTLQDVLGTFQDSEAQRDTIYALAADMMLGGDADSRTILAMGEIAARLQESMQASRAEFAGTFSSFGRLSVPRRMARLTPSPAEAARMGAPS
jgi:CHAD domain-containing protein